ncbi:MAG: MotB family protein [Rhodocyclaceae bacterium]
MEEPEEEKAGIPPWVMTFADLMSLLMCFFVLLLSFAEMDAIKFREIASEMAKAFGVQREVAATQPPMGTSPVFDKFSPGTPRPTETDSVRQETTEQRPQLRTFTSDAQTEASVEALSAQKMAESVEQLRKVLENEIAEGSLQLDHDRKRIVIRVEERGSFPSGSADMTGQFQSLLDRVGEVLHTLPGELTIEGHTDDRPISTARFRSNWDLSAARASSVANALLRTPDLDPRRLRVQGYADTSPRADNSTAEGRALNRRVEIVVDMSDPVDSLEARARELIERGKSDMAWELEW